MRYDFPDTLHFTFDTESKGVRKGYCLQLVQTSHKRTEEHWVERSEWVTEDLYSMFWYKLIGEGTFGMTNEVSCSWVSHPAQRHRFVSEKYGGGLNQYRNYYQVKSPVKMRVSEYKFIDEEKLYSNFREKQSSCESSLKIVLLGELAYNPERIYALEEAGHQLYGL